MIVYDNGGAKFLWNIARIDGSVFPRALCVSLPCSAITMLLVLGINAGWTSFFSHLNNDDSVMNNNAVWGGFSVLAGFLVIFRTSQAYSRFWEGATSTHKMGAEWFDSCSSLVAFCKASTASPEAVADFQNLLVRLFSMLHAAALGEIEDSSLDDIDANAFNMDLIDPEAIDEASILFIKECDAKVELIFQWIQQLVVYNIKTGVLSIAPPILSRAFQEIASGMVHFHDAMKISSVPFPFPYAQTCDCLLLLHWALVPFVVSQWVDHHSWAGIFSFMQVFALWVLNFIAMELENPFGTDANDIDGESMQRVMNNNLRLLLHPKTMRIPHLASAIVDDQEATKRMLAESDGCTSVSFLDVWDRVVDAGDTTYARRQAGTTVCKKRLTANSMTSQKAESHASRCARLCGKSGTSERTSLRLSDRRSRGTGDTEESRGSRQLSQAPAHSSMPSSAQSHVDGFNEPRQPPGIKRGMDITGSPEASSGSDLGSPHGERAPGAPLADAGSDGRDEHLQPGHSGPPEDKGPPLDGGRPSGACTPEGVNGDKDDLDIEKLIADRLQEINDCIDQTPMQGLPPDPDAEKRNRLFAGQEAVDNREIEPLLYVANKNTSRAVDNREIEPLLYVANKNTSRARSCSPEPGGPPPDRPPDATHCSAMQGPFIACTHCLSDDGPEMPAAVTGKEMVDIRFRSDNDFGTIGALPAPSSPSRSALALPELEEPPPLPAGSI